MTTLPGKNSPGTIDGANSESVLLSADTGPFREHEFLAWLRDRAPHDDAVDIAIGDDAAAVVDGFGNRQLIALDTVVEGTHVERGDEVPEQLGRKAILANLSDIAAMGGRPEWALAGLTLPEGAPAEWAKRAMEAMFQACREWGVVLVGGDTTVGGNRMVVTIAMTGRPIARPISRAGARPGDVIGVTGAFGGSILGKHLDFTPRLAEARTLVQFGPPSAMCDVSDGLLRDLANILALSKCGAELDGQSIPLAAAAHEAAKDGHRSALEHALHDGEDFELLFTAPGEVLESIAREWRHSTVLTRIGRIVPRGLTLVIDGVAREVEPGGFDHGRWTPPGATP